MPVPTVEPIICVQAPWARVSCRHAPWARVRARRWRPLPITRLRVNVADMAARSHRRLPRAPMRRPHGPPTTGSSTSTTPDERLLGMGCSHCDAPERESWKKIQPETESKPSRQWSTVRGCHVYTSATHAQPHAGPQQQPRRITPAPSSTHGAWRATHRSRAQPPRSHRRHHDRRQPTAAARELLPGAAQGKPARRQRNHVRQSEGIPRIRTYRRMAYIGPILRELQIVQ